MTDLRFEFDWEQPEGAVGPELRATWARFQVNVGNVPVTRGFHADAKTVRDYIYLPLYPIAEWIADRWWHLHSGSQPQNVRFAREGFCLPDLEFFPLGDTVQVRWSGRSATDWPVRFMESGSALLPLTAATQELARLVRAVIERLSLEGVGETFLLQTWEQNQRLDSEEQEFCKAAAALGLDPFDVTEPREKAILEAHRQLEGESGLVNEFFHAAHPDRISEQLDHLRRARQRLHVDADGGSPLTAGDLSFDPGHAPWEQGYRLARELRERLGIEAKLFRDVADITSTISANGGPPLIEADSADLFDALAARNGDGGVAFALAADGGREETRAFALCRAIGELAWGGRASSSSLRMVTTSQTEHQKRNRAFAAEFLAPSKLLAQRVRSPTINLERIEDLAQDFAVSPLLIEHQLENHGLAKVEP